LPGTLEDAEEDANLRAMSAEKLPGAAEQDPILPACSEESGPRTPQRFSRPAV